MRVEPLCPAHIERLDLQPQQEGWGRDFTAADWLSVEGWAGIVGEVVIGVSGIIDLGGGRGECWSLLSRHAGPHMTTITRAVRRAIAAAPYRYLQMHTARDFEAASRWAAMLGFAARGVLPGYCDDGGDGLIWTRAVGK